MNWPTRNEGSISRSSPQRSYRSPARDTRSRRPAKRRSAASPHQALKATGPDGKEFTIYFDKTSGLPVKLVAKMVGFDGQEYNEEQTYENYKDFGGIKKATKLEAKRDGENFLTSEITEFKVLDHVDPKTFSAPE